MAQRLVTCLCHLGSSLEAKMVNHFISLLFMKEVQVAGSSVGSYLSLCKGAAYGIKEALEVGEGDNREAVGIVKAG